MQWKTFVTMLATLAALATANGALAQSAAPKDVSAGAAKAQACAACHGADGNPASPLFPTLAGQSWRYIYVQLKDFKEAKEILLFILSA